jgi:hypothetical protein
MDWIILVIVLGGVLLLGIRIGRRWGNPALRASPLEWAFRKITRRPRPKQ